MQLTHLNAAEIPLSGKHLIEASAGTGKTYNITRIYLRLLLERELTVEQILLMTFTKDATQELRGRIGSFIRDALNNWQKLCEDDSYFAAINARVAADKIQFLLKRALLFLDEAAIFTIHGFCQRALSQHAFASGLPFNTRLATNSHDLVIEACQDWYRQLAKQTDNFTLVASFWSHPNSFLKSFTRAISKKCQLDVIDSEVIVNEFIALAKQAKTAILAEESTLQTGLIAHKKADEQQKRAEQLTALLLWLTRISECDGQQRLLDAIAQPFPDYLLNGNRHPKAYKPQLAEILAPCKEIKIQLKNLAKNISKAEAYKVVRIGIYYIRERVSAKKQQQNVLDFDDLISTLASNLQQAAEPSEQNEANLLAQTLLAQYPVALVDEFQDTDPEQFAILRGIYYTAQAKSNDAALYLIGDPKQAIYGFRGGDIFAYLNARHHCDYHWLMDTNYRSTPAMIDAYNQVFLGKDEEKTPSVFGFGISYQAVNAGKPADESADNLDGRALQFIHFTHDEEKAVTVQYGCPLMARWCANEIYQLIHHQQVTPHDIAILVRDTREASFIKQALQDAALASVYLSDRTNLFASEQAQQLLVVLKGIVTPEHDRTFLAAIVSGLLGFDAAKLYQLQQDEFAYQQLKFAFFDYKKQWHSQGFIAMAIQLLHQHFVIEDDSKDRVLTNLLHLFEILQATSQRLLQPEELIYWFEQQCQQDLINNELEAELRLENEGNLIRIITQHGAKGLEYPIVFIPFATKHKDPLKFGNQNISYLEYHNAQGELVLSLDGDDNAKAAMAKEAYAETIRLLYVAITRAEKRCYIFTTTFDKAHLSPLGQTLAWQSDTDMVQQLTSLSGASAADSQGENSNSATNNISVEQVALSELSLADNLTLADALTDTHAKAKDSSSEDSSAATIAKTAPPTLAASKFVGKIERDWWLSSFTALSRNMRNVGISTPDRDSAIAADSSQATQPIQPIQSMQAQELSATDSLLRFALTKGAHSGNLLHDILEHTDFAKANWQEIIDQQLVKYGELLTAFTSEDLEQWLAQVIKAPLTDAEPSMCLADIAQGNTLRESEFYFPMEQASVRALERVLRDHRHALNTANTNQTQLVSLPNYQSLKGMMHGFIDLVFEHEGKYYVCDYKSSHLGDLFSDYSNQAMLENIEKNYYDLQYLIYALALHRYLQLNLPDYNPAQHFGGVYYFYLRGMSNDAEHQGAGVYFTEIKTTILSQLDQIFTGTFDTNTNTSAQLSNHQESV